MTALTFARAKDSVLIGLASLLVAILGSLLRGQTQANATLAEVKKDIAVIATEGRRDREELADIKQRVRALEARLK